MIDLLGGECESCGRNLIVDRRLADLHHIDGDRENNVKDNVKLLCRTCHRYEHCRGRIALHVSDPNDWRNRREDHPNDPGWEGGTYRSCHKEMRKNVRKGDWIVDAIPYSGPSGRYIGIRSMFAISRIRNGVLYFGTYWFAKGHEPIKLTRSIVKKLRPDKLRNEVKDEFKQMLFTLRQGLRVEGKPFADFVKHLKKRMVRRKPSRELIGAKQVVCGGCVDS